MNNPGIFKLLAWIATGLAVIVIVVGAWVRLTDAGLGCPDWPGCYGTVTWPSAPDHVEQANRDWGHVREVESGKAFREMFHRYLAGALGLVILAMAILAWRRRGQPGQPIALPMATLVLVIFQAALGMWTVTLLLKPAIVTAHLLGGMATLALLWWTALRVTPSLHRTSLPARAQHTVALAALGVVIVQIFLGGWVSTNYAALACTGFPTCNGQWWPQMDFAEGFRLWRGVGVDYEGGVLDPAARNAIQMAHRLWALVVVGVLGWALSRFWRAEELRAPALLLGVLLTAQVLVGIYNVVGGLPLVNAVAHNGLAALLLAALLFILFRTRTA